MDDQSGVRQWWLDDEIGVLYEVRHSTASAWLDRVEWNGMVADASGSGFSSRDPARTISSSGRWCVLAFIIQSTPYR